MKCEKSSVGLHAWLYFFAGYNSFDHPIRETKEESGIDIEVTKFCGVFQNVNASICNTLFLGRPVGGELTTTPESLEVRFFPIETALEMVSWGNFKQRIELCLKEEHHPFYIEFSIPLKEC